MRDLRPCELCDNNRACGFYCKWHHVLVCDKGASPKDVRALERLISGVVSDSPS